MEGALGPFNSRVLSQPYDVSDVDAGFTDDLLASYAGTNANGTTLDLAFRSNEFSSIATLQPHDRESRKFQGLTEWLFQQNNGPYSTIAIGPDDYDGTSLLSITSIPTYLTSATTTTDEGTKRTLELKSDMDVPGCDPGFDSPPNTLYHDVPPGTATAIDVTRAFRLSFKRIGVPPIVVGSCSAIWSVNQNAPSVVSYVLTVTDAGDMIHQMTVGDDTTIDVVQSSSGTTDVYFAPFPGGGHVWSYYRDDELQKVGFIEGLVNCPWIWDSVNILCPTMPLPECTVTYEGVPE